MDDERLLAQMGLMLTQLRYARRALEDLERSVATYGGLSFLQRMAPEQAFGAPPLVGGALSVHVVNIRDLAYGGPSFLESLFGGIGRFLGGLVGGVAGGTVAGLALPRMISDVAHLADVVDRIVERTRFRFREGGGGASAGSASSESQLPALTDALYGFAALFRAAAGGPGSGPSSSQTAALEQLERFLRPIHATLAATARVVDGLVLLLPIATGAFSWLLDRIGALKLVFVELLQFLLRNVFLLRGVALVTLGDTLATAARLGSGILRILGDAAGRIFEALFTTLGDLVHVALEALRFIAGGVAATVDPLLDWAVARVFHALNALSQTPLFRVFYHVVDILPNLLPALVRLVRGTGLDSIELGRLNGIASALPPLTTAAPRLGSAPRAPDFAAAFRPSPELAALESDIRSLGPGMRATVDYAFGQARGALARTGRFLESEGYRGQLDERLRAVQQQSQRLAEALEPARERAAAPGRTGLDVIARAYEQWIGGGGLNALLGAVARHFRRDPEVAERLVAEAALERARATVDIAEVVVELETAAVRTAAGAAELLPEPALIDQVVEALRDRMERGALPGLDAFSFA